MKPVKLFYSYSHKDEDLREELVKHLTILKRQGVLDPWHDRYIEAGTEWNQEIERHLNESQIILLLISSDFIASPFCWDKEMARAIERHDAGEAVVIPIILRSCDWKGSPFGKLQGLPKDMKPVNEWPDRDQAFTNIAQGIRKVAEKIAHLDPAAVNAARLKVSADSVVGQRTAQGWIDRVITQLIQSLRAVETLLAQAKVWTWQRQTRTFAEIHAAENLVHPSAKDTLEHFAERHPDVQATMSLYDQRTGELLAACQRLQMALADSEELRSLYEQVKADDSAVYGGAISRELEIFTETERLESLAESIVNRRHKESFEYTFRHLWSRYHDEFLALRDLPDIRPESERVDRAADELLETVRALISLLKATGKHLADKHDASF